MATKVLYRRHGVLVRRLILKPGEATHWHQDLCHRVTVVLSGDRLAIEFAAGGPVHEVGVHPGQVDWDTPSSRVHRAVNVGRERYVEVVTFLLAHRGQNPQPTSVVRTRSRPTRG